MALDAAGEEKRMGNPLIVSWIRDWLRSKGYEALIVTSEDRHQSEYVADADKKREFVSGFTGSAGTAVISLSHAWLWTDARYLLQAAQELDKEAWSVMAVIPRQSGMAEHLAATLPPNSLVAVDSWLMPLTTARTLESKLNPQGHKLVPLETSPIDDLWTHRPPLSSSLPFLHPVQHAGQTAAEKLAAVRADMSTLKTDALIVSALDEVAWLLNVRGSDVPYNPVVVSYALVTASSCVWYVRQGAGCAGAGVEDELKAGGVTLKAYADIETDLEQLGTQGATVLIDPAKCSWQVYNLLTAQKAAQATSFKVVEKVSPITWLKSIKNASEIAGLREAHLRDAVALCSFIAWIERTMRANTPLTEITAAAKLENFRKAQEGYLSPSFATITAYGENGAVIHYHATEATNKLLGYDSPYLCDSGGHYFSDQVAGTTDVTRTLHFGSPADHHKRCYTRVLRGHIALSSAVFPLGTTGHMLDLLARTPLWQAGLDYAHGTGHGVGAFLCVHEGPQLISYYPRDPDPPMKEGMTSSIEPGYYEEGNFGLRLENVAVVKKAVTQHSFRNTPFFTFDPLTLVPFSAKLIEIELLTPDEAGWVDAYHERVWAELHPRLSGDEVTREWLRKNTLPLVEQIYGESIPNDD